MSAFSDPAPKPAAKSKVETLKENSRNLRGTIAQELAESTARFSGDAAGLLKFHGLYQQEDRDQRRARKEAGTDKQYQFMARSKIPGGRLSPKQYLVHDDLATRYANGTLRVTTRQDFQFHGLLKGDLYPTLKTLNDNLVTTLGACGDIARNVMTCPAPTADREAINLQEYAREISDHTLPRGQAYHEIWIDGERVTPAEPEEEPLYGRHYLPRKFKTGIAFPGDNCIDVFTQDLGYVPEVRNGRVVGFTLLAGGGLGMTHHKAETYPRLADPIVFVRPDQLLASVEAVIGIHRDFGDRTNRRHARLKYVVAEMGVPAFAAEVERRVGGVLEAPRRLIWRAVVDHFGWGAQADGRLFLGLPVENGRIQDTEQMAQRTAIREIVTRFAGEVRLTAQQNILIGGIDPADRAAVETILRQYHVPMAEAIRPIVRDALACPAIPTCGLALAEAERALPSIVRELAGELERLGLAEEEIGVRMTGCPNGCARPYVAEIGFVGKTAGVYDVFLGADPLGRRLGTLFQASVPSGQLVATLTPIFEAFRAERQPGERFGDYCDRIGPAGLQTRGGVPVGVR